MNITTGARLPATLNDLFLFAMMLTIAAILTTAMILQYYGGEIPCPLCLLQRVAMFGVCFGIMLDFHHGRSARVLAALTLTALLAVATAGCQTTQSADATGSLGSPATARGESRAAIT